MMKWGLNLKFICYTVFIVVFISLVFSAVFIFQSRKALLQEFRNTAESLVKNLALNIEVPLFIENQSALVSLAQNLMKEETVQSVSIYNEAGKALVSLSKSRRLFPWQKELVVYQVYFSSDTGDAMTDEMKLYSRQGAEGSAGRGADRAIGTIEVLFSRDSIISALNRMRWWIFISATIAAFIGGIAALYFSRTLILPVQRLAQATYSIARGNWEERLSVSGSDELGQLTESFNLMAQSLISKRDELEDTYRALGHRDRLAEIGKFSTIIAHELKNPLGIIKGAVDIIAKPHTTPQLNETMTGYIQDEVRRLNKIIDDFLAFARPAPPQKQLCDVNDVVRKLAAHFSVPDEEQKNVQLQLDLCGRTQTHIDEDQIYQVLLNLANNAQQAMERDGSITIRTGCHEGLVTLQVQDSGPGIPYEIREKVFEPFFTTKTQGTGLGLAIVKKFIESHQGGISIADAPGGGTIFKIVLPGAEA
jgi:signal transduction histidine kinase